ncbi:hypothetical protein GGS21DRAFT_493719 [Xylaria nigripes]|nr:hypothetical protein GGS21DRAFT_493719 [Xylaria nigripes]
MKWNQAISAYSFASCAWNALQALPLLRKSSQATKQASKQPVQNTTNEDIKVGPQLITTLLTQQTYNTPPPTPQTIELENYLARSLGFAHLALGLITVVLTGSVPLVSIIDNDPSSPYKTATLLLTTLYHATTAFHSWAYYSASDRAAHALGFTGSAVLAAFGTWCLLFAGEKARVSRRTGADKRTSGFPFRNLAAERQWKGR